MMSQMELLRKKSHPVDQALTPEEIQQYLTVLDGWSLQGLHIAKSFEFKNYYQTIAFVNAIAFIVHTEDHHPELEVGYNRCVVKFYTHSVNEGLGGISENDFICAAKIDALAGNQFAPMSH
ncbi:4a-hydroxytetrahydrobiopterin dehydratase [Bdellovibrio bacteriovorus]|uniref:Putative pterin-4-alpha-carbinolamine dehydratase n=1 Tax=Bdellovibrio bacteriovorus str. Tiberius TaxID=1069642 RepID=K7ZEK0_BDEBC|nr:4a-hydroxytetrahydrobiopterin dehydratase [Bdellovibrio bacteriovorus]AFY00552.1 pterin-4-alpha-carbinolamine dehydratase [Bdellovibrio bacteriovorus str. Tiberius]